MLAVPGGGGEVRPGRRGRGAFRRAPAAAGEPGGRGVRGEDGPLLAVRRQRPRPGEAERSLSAARAAGPGGRWLGGGAPRGAAVRSVAVKGTLLRMCFFFIIIFFPILSFTSLENMADPSQGVFAGIRLLNQVLWRAFPAVPGKSLPTFLKCPASVCR